MRKCYLDNIRWVVIVLVLVFHVISIFCSCGALMSYNAPGIPALDAVGYMIYPWFMPCLFVVSGMCARYALLKRSNREFLKERTWKLLIPFLSYLVLIGPFASSLTFHVNHLEETFSALPGFILLCIRIVNGMGPSWFLLQLFLVSLILVMFCRMDRKEILPELGGKYNFPILLLLYIPVFLAAQFLYLAYTFRVVLYLLLFLMGYSIFSHDKVQELLQRYSLPLLAAGAALGVAQTCLSWGQPFQNVVNHWLVMLYAWVMILAVIGAAGRWFNFSNRFTLFFNRLSFGMYYFHYVPMVYAAYFLTTRFSLPKGWNYILVFIISFLTSILFYECFSRIPVLRVIMGLRKPSPGKKR